METSKVAINTCAGVHPKKVSYNAGLARDLCSLISTLNRFNEHMSPGDLSLQPTTLIGT